MTSRAGIPPASGRVIAIRGPAKALMPIYAVEIAQVPSVNTPTIRRLLRVDAGLSLVNSPQHMRIRKLLRDI